MMSVISGHVKTVIYSGGQIVKGSTFNVSADCWLPRATCVKTVCQRSVKSRGFSVVIPQIWG